MPFVCSNTLVLMPSIHDEDVSFNVSTIFLDTGGTKGNVRYDCLIAMRKFCLAAVRFVSKYSSQGKWFLQGN